MNENIAALPGGVIILGGAHGAMAFARSLGRQKIPVWLISNDHPLPGWSRYIKQMIHWTGPSSSNGISSLLQIAETRHLKGSLLVPAADADVHFVSANRASLSQHFRIVLPEWAHLQHLVDKSLLYRLAETLNVAVPKTYALTSVAESMDVEMQFPVILKPDMGGGKDAFTRAKVIRANNRPSFEKSYKNATKLIGANRVVVQELVPGGGETQFSYAALWFDGKPVGEFTARRSRQYPVDFGYTSTFVEVIEDAEVRETSRRILNSIPFNGLVEIEYKRDPRNGVLKLLDVNPRPWAWFSLAEASGVDLGAMLWEKVVGLEVTPATARPNVAWMYLSHDFASAVKLCFMGRLGILNYLRSFLSVRVWGTFDIKDPMPGLIDMPLTAWRVLTKRILKLG